MPRSCYILLFTLPLAFPDFVRADDDLQRFVERNKIQQQKFQEEIQSAVDRARQLEKTDLAGARVLLERALADLRSADFLTAEPRAKLKIQLETRLRDVEQQERVAQQRQLDDARVRAERETIRLRNDLPPASNSPASLAERYLKEAKAVEASRTKLRQDNARAATDVMNSVRISSIPANGDYELPKDWAARSKAREKITGARLSQKEVALLKALDSPLGVKFKNNSFREVLNYLMERTGQPILVDEQSMKDAMVEYDDQVNFEVPRANFRTVLKKVLADRGLAYIIKEGALQIVTAQKARDTMTVRAYPIDDLVQSPGLIGPTPFLSPDQALRMQASANAASIVQMIQSQIEPTQWQVNGGPATITYYEPGKTLIVRASAELHMQLARNSFLGR